jgi:hypothetical protein
MTKINMIIKHCLSPVAFTFTFTLFLLPSFTVSASIDEKCLSQAGSYYERIYCEVVGRGEGRGLPRFEDFEQNDVLVQKLLLKRPAAKLKIKLPSHKTTNQASHKQVASRANIAKTKKPKSNSASSNETYISPTLSSVSIKQCRLTHDKILCGKDRFVMKTNQPNKKLSPGVLDESYTMNLPVYSGNKEDDLEVQYYLSNAYTVYIRKMLDIGLGASTMSYTRFFHTYYDLQAKNVSFCDRFETMYRYLKKDKKSMIVNAVLSDKRPEHISQCEEINEQIIACDSGGFNWIYVN